MVLHCDAVYNSRSRQRETADANTRLYGNDTSPLPRVEEEPHSTQHQETRLREEGKHTAVDTTAGFVNDVKRNTADRKADMSRRQRRPSQFDEDQLFDTDADGDKVRFNLQQRQELGKQYPGRKKHPAFDESFVDGAPPFAPMQFGVGGGGDDYGDNGPVLSDDETDAPAPISLESIPPAAQQWLALRPSRIHPRVNSGFGMRNK